ncbi:MAG: glycosyltransferase family 2 protein [Nitrospirae bacterium]|nr:MAG: glycosyltransferase family 2 protein [Nitrospirota bacterium]
MTDPLAIKRHCKVAVVLPAFNAAKTLKQTVQEIPREWVDCIILVDDASQDQTATLARQLGLYVVEHARNRGYGGNQKTCYQEALAQGAEIVVMVHPDYQYDPRQIPQLITPILLGECDAVLGSRMLGGKFLQGGMPVWKFYGNVLLTALANLVLKVFFSEYHSGFRAYSRRYLETVNFLANSEDFVFDMEILIQGIIHELRICEIPISTRYPPEASQIGVLKSLKYAGSILVVLTRFWIHRRGWHRFKSFAPMSSNPVDPLT